MIEDGRPIFQQIAELIENSVVDGSLPEETQAPSTTELATFHRINPATAAKGLNSLVGDGILYKKRGIGMFVATGASARLRERRRARFVQQFIEPLLAEAGKLGMDPDEIADLIRSVRVPS